MKYDWIAPGLWLITVVCYFMFFVSAVGRGRHHMDESLVQKAVTIAAPAAGVTKRVTCHTFRRPFAMRLLTSGYDIRTVQELLGHKDVRTTMIYTHVLTPGGRGVRGPPRRVRQAADENLPSGQVVCEDVSGTALAAGMFVAVHAIGATGRRLAPYRSHRRYDLIRHSP